MNCKNCGYGPLDESRRKRMKYDYSYVWYDSKRQRQVTTLNFDYEVIEHPPNCKTEILPGEAPILTLCSIATKV